VASAAFLRAILTSTGFNSMPSTIRNEYCEAISMARPMPAPASTKANSSMGANGLLLSHRRIRA